MKKAVITTGNKQYIISEGDVLDIELIGADKTLSFEALLAIDGETIKVGTPLVEGTKVTAEVVEAEIKADKVTAIRYKSKKRVHKVHGHRQKLSRIKITKIV